MKFTPSIVGAAFAIVAQAQTTPQGFSPATNTKLDVQFNSTSVAAPGQLLSKLQTASQPQLAAPANAVNQAETYVFVMIDLDVPPLGSNSTRRTLLHAMTTDFKATAQSVGGNNTLLATNSKGPAPYLGPGPPATDTIAHRYVQLLFKQPATLAAAVASTNFQTPESRIGFDVVSFAAQMELGQPIAGNFFTVDGRANPGVGGGVDGGASGTGFGSPSATSSGGINQNTLQPFEGAVGRMEMPLGLVGLLGSLAVFL